MKAQDEPQGVPAQAQEASKLQISDRRARLTFLAGDLKVQRADNTGEDGAVVNMPLDEGTRLLAGPDGRAEVEFEDGSLLRMTPGSGVSLDSLALHGSVAETRISLLGGLAYFELRAARGSLYSIQAAGLEIAPVENAAFRIKLDETSAPEIAVLSGTVRVNSPEHFHVGVRAGESLRLDGNDQDRYFLDGTYAEETWDWWNEERDQTASDQAAHATAARNTYAGVQGYGWSDMDANGTWYDVPGQGLVWQPDVADESFDPYGFGNWVYDAGGYVFASGYSWGWTPFRCGSWAWTSGFGWGWSGAPECGRWGFAGGRRKIVLGALPGHYRRPEPPPLGGPVHRILAVRSPDGARPPVLLPNRIAVVTGRRVEPLRPVGTPYTPHGGSAVGRALLRDFPVTEAHQPVLGVEAGSLRAPGGTPGWHGGTTRPTTSRTDKDPHPVQSRPATAGARPADDVRGQRRDPAGAVAGSLGSTSARSTRIAPDPPAAPNAPAAPGAPGTPLGATHSVPIPATPGTPRRGIPVPQPGNPTRDQHHAEPIPAPVRTAPPPASSPVRTAPSAPAPTTRSAPTPK